MGGSSNSDDRLGRLKTSGGQKPSFNWDLIMSASRPKKTITYPQGFFETLTTLTEDLILVVNEQKQIQYASPSVRLLGFVPEDVLDTSFSDYVVPEDRTVMKQLFQDLVSQPQETASVRQIYLQQADGDRRCFSVVGRNLLKLPAVEGFVCTFHDMTEYREVEQNLVESKAQFEQIVSTACEGIAILQEKHIKYANPRLIEMLGYPRERLLDTPFMEFVAPEFLEDTIQYYEQQEKEKNNQPVMETVLNREDHQSIQVEIKASRLRYGGRPAELFIVRDITKQKRTEEALRESEQYLLHLFEHMREGVYRINTEGKYLLVNSSLSRMLGYESPDELIGKRVGDLLHMTQPTLHRLQTELDKKGEVTNFQYLCRTKDERFVVFKENAHVVRDGEGKPVFYEGTVEDITEVKDLETQLRKSQKMEVLGRVASEIAHDFNNILTNISGAAQILETKLEDEEHLKYTDIIASGITLGQTLGERILTFANSRRPQQKNVPGMQFLEKFRTMAEPTAGENIHLHLQSEVETDWLYIDPHQVERVLFNLVTNAIDAMPSEGEVSLILHSPSPDMQRKYPRQSEKSFLCISVSDTGQGMDEHTLEHLFEPFFTTKQAGKGTGLGMTIAYNVMKLHGGWIDVTSQPGEGTTVTLGVPAGTPDITSGETPADREEVLDIMSRGEHVLLVDDEEALCEIISTELRRLGYKVWVAANGDEALRIFNSPGSDIQIVITDIKMPRLDGIELLKELRTQNTDLPIVAITGVVERQRLQEVEPAAFNVILRKPLLLQDLLRELRTLLDENEPVAP